MILWDLLLVSIVAAIDTCSHFACNLNSIHLLSHICIVSITKTVTASLQGTFLHLLLLAFIKKEKNVFQFPLPHLVLN